MRHFHLAPTLVTIVLAASSGACAHRHCVFYSETPTYIEYCASMGNGYCQRTERRSAVQRTCELWDCDVGYEESKSGTCVASRSNSLAPKSTTATVESHTAVVCEAPPTRWAPSTDGTRAAFETTCNLTDADTDTTTDVYVRDLEDGWVTRINPLPDTYVGTRTTLAGFVGDSNTIAVLRTGTGRQAALVLHALNSGAERLLWSQNADGALVTVDIAIAANGRVALLNALDANDRRTVTIIDIASGQAHSIEAKGSGKAVVSADGSTFVYASGANLYMRATSGRGQTTRLFSGTQGAVVEPLGFNARGTAVLTSVVEGTRQRIFFVAVANQRITPLCNACVSIVTAPFDDSVVFSSFDPALTRDTRGNLFVGDSTSGAVTSLPVPERGKTNYPTATRDGEISLFVFADTQGKSAAQPHLFVLRRSTQELTRVDAPGSGHPTVANR